MQLSKQLCELQQSVRLKELGVIQESVFWIYQERTPTNSNMVLYGYPQANMPWQISKTGKPSSISTNRVFREYALYSVSELGVMLPPETSSYYYINPIIEEAIWICEYPSIDNVISGNQAEVMARMLINLIELAQTSASEVNERLRAA